jgi:hypothetical protein
MSLSYGWEKFYTALSGAISNQDSLQMRLANAYTYHLIRLGSDDVPVEVWTELQKLAQVVTAKAAVGNEGSVVASTSLMSDEEAAKWLEKIVSMFSDVAQAYGIENHQEEIGTFAEPF